jgi:signal peptidase I
MTDPIPASERPAALARRRWWLAALLSMLAFGLGYIYAGSWRRAVIAILLICLLISSFILTASRTVLAVYIGGLLYILLWLFVVIDAGRLCRRTPLQQLRTYQRWYVVVPVGIALAIGIDQFNQFALHLSRARSFHSPAMSMAPTMQIGDYFMVKTERPGEMVLHRGDIVVFHVPGNVDYVKRVIGLPGDHVEIRDNLASVTGIDVQHIPFGDGEKVSGDCGHLSAPRYREVWPDGHDYSVCALTNSRLSSGTFDVPADHIFVLGDNRGNSMDSRVEQVGFVPIEAVFGTAIYIYWAKDLRRIGNRLD